jgi:chlorophyllide a reductase subunit Y
LAQVINAALASKPRFDEMRAFFEGVGVGDCGGVWSSPPQPHPEYREFHLHKMEKLARKRKAEEMV